jgi:hypothetical protein
MTRDYHTINGTDLVRKHDKGISGRDLPEAYVTQTISSFAVRDLRSPSSQSIQDRGGTAARKLFKGCPSGKHQDDDGTNQVFAENYGSDDRNSREVVGSEFEDKNFSNKSKNQWRTSCNEHHNQRCLPDSFGDTH